MFMFVIPRRRQRDIDLALSVRLIVRPDVQMSVRPSQTCWGYLSKTITAITMKLKECIDLIEEKCTAQEP